MSGWCDKHGSYEVTTGSTGCPLCVQIVSVEAAGDE